MIFIDIAQKLRSPEVTSGFGGHLLSRNWPAWSIWYLHHSCTLWGQVWCKRSFAPATSGLEVIQGHWSNDLDPISRQRLEAAHSNKIWWIAFTLGYLETPNMSHAPLPGLQGPTSENSGSKGHRRRTFCLYVGIDYLTQKDRSRHAEHASFLIESIRPILTELWPFEVFLYISI